MATRTAAAAVAKRKTAAEPEVLSPSPTTALAVAALNLGLNHEIKPDVSTLARGLHQGLTHQKPDPAGGRMSLHALAYTLGAILREYLPDES